ncbi:MAG: TetR/AcrR family transcriptional regulator [Cyanobacteria bacterium J06636_16]
MAANTSKTAGMRRKPRQARSQERVNRILDVAEQLFIEVGYNATTTNAIATQANVPIGSLYQFFPDKAAILYALAERYNEVLRRRIAAVHSENILEIPLLDYVNQLVNTADQFFADCPGYHAIFMQVQGTMPELEQLETAADAQLIQDCAAELALRDANLTTEDCEAIAFVMVKAIGNVLWLSLSQSPKVRKRLVAETKRFTLHYLQSYFKKQINRETQFS